MTDFEGIGDFDSSDPHERYIAHQAAKGHSVTHKPPMFTQGHYNALAKEIRELYPAHIEVSKSRAGEELAAYRTILVVLALNLAKRFKVDNPRFDPVRFLDACSPNVDLYPLSELWEDADRDS